MTTLPTHYRVKDALDESGVHIILEKWNPIGETPEGYWVLREGGPYWPGIDKKYQRKTGALKWVSKTSVRRYCYPSMSEAMRSFKRRKEVQVSRLAIQLEQAQLALAKFDDYKDETPNSFPSRYEGIRLGEIEAASNLIWDY
jgi:hypothetical protein